MKRVSLIRYGIAALLILITGFLLGRWTDVPSGSRTGSVSTPSTAPIQIYTCSMHTQVRLDRPGKCPICEMPLVPASDLHSSGDTAATLSLSEHALAMASVETTPVTYRELSRDLRAVGKIQYNEPSLATVTARVDGYAEKLFVNVTGVNIKAGDHLIELYSPDLLVAEQELSIALQDGTSGPLVETSKLKLRRWGLTEKQVDDLITSRKFTDRVTLYSPITGTVIEKLIFENSAFRAGDVLYRIANLDTVWIYLDIYEFDLAWIRYGQKVQIVTEAYPAHIFEGMVTFVEPVINDQTRTVRVPVHIDNKDHKLKPGMYASAVIKVALGQEGKAAPTGVEGKFTCPMHPQILKEETGQCYLCDMALEQIPGTTSVFTPQPAYVCPMKCEGQKTYPEPGICPVCNMKLKLRKSVTLSPRLLAVPLSAVLDSGLRKIVYVEKTRGTFESREVTLGPRCSDFFPVLNGLSEGERVVTRGGFLIDSQFQITGHPSLYYPGGLHATMDHQHGKTQTGSDPLLPDDSTPPRKDSSHSDSHDHE